MIYQNKFLNVVGYVTGEKIRRYSMSIIYNPNKRIFTLHTRNTTYQMMIDQYGYLLHLYYGTKNNGLMDYLIM